MKLETELEKAEREFLAAAIRYRALLQENADKHPVCGNVDETLQ